MREELLSELNDKVDLINKIIEENMPKEEGRYALIVEAMNYSVKVGGKRLRPLLIRETYKLFSKECKEEKLIETFMTAIELIHTYSLVHDDLPAMDNDLLRRGQVTTHAKFGEDFGILAGDGLLNYAYEIIFKMAVELDAAQAEKMLKAGKVLSEKAGVYGMVGGQSLDVYLTGKQMSSEDLDFIFRLKTGALIEASFMIGAIIAGASKEEVLKVQKAGDLIGRAFQIRDDILDETASAEEIGKPAKSDEKNNKCTYVTLYGLEKASKDVEEMSKEAIGILKTIGDNPFLIGLLEGMVTRKK